MLTRYSPALCQRFFAPEFAGTLDLALPQHYRLREESGMADLRLQWDVQCVEGTILRARFLAYGSPALYACADYLCEYSTGQTLSIMIKMTATDFIDALALLPSQQYAVLTCLNVVERLYRQLA